MSARDHQRRRLRVGDRLDGDAVDAGDREAVVRTADGPIRVRGVVPGDRVRVAVTHVGRNAVWGEVDEVLSPSPERVAPRCDRVATCGGCPWQAWDPAAQRREKARRLTLALSDLGSLPIEPVRAAPVDYGHRNKLLLAAGGRPGDLAFGLYAPRTHDVVPAEGCPVHDPVGDAVLRAVKERLDARRLAPWNERTGAGVLRHLLIRVAPGTGQVGVTLVVARWPLRGGRAIGRALLELPGVVSVWANHNPKPTSIALGPVSARLGGRQRLLARVGDAAYLVTPTGFFQTSSPALPLLVDAVASGLPARIEHLLDLYAGVGLFSLALAPRARRVTAVEAVPTAIDDLREGARLAGARHVRGLAIDAAALRPPRPLPDVVVVDPPRVGLPGAVLERLADWRPAHVAYVSCNPDALGRDLRRLLGAGYRATRVLPIDLFPHTPHLETVVHLQRTA